jgi:hypothetical protein
MSTLITRPTATASRPGEVDAGRPLATSAAVGGGVAAAIGLVVCMSAALTGWFLADAGAHGQTTDALRVGADAWLLGHGSHLTLSGVPLGVTPLGITLVLVLTAFRTGRWAGSRVRGDARRAIDGRTLASAIGTFTCAYVVVAVVTCVLASQSGATPALGRAVLGAVLVAALAGGAGLAIGTGRATDWLTRVPEWVLDVVSGGLAGALWLVAAGAVLVGVALVGSLNEAATVLSELHLSAGDALSYTLVMALFAPNAVLFGVSYLVGPGFAFGVGTTVSPTAVSLGVVPAYPVLAALPNEGPTPGWLVVAMGAPVAAAALGAAAMVGRTGPLAHDLVAIRGAAAGFVSGLLVTVLVAAAGGSLGTGRMADVGAPVAEVLVFATGLMAVGGLFGALVQGWLMRRRGEPVRPPRPTAGGSRPAVADSQAHPRARSTSSRPAPARSSQDPGSDELTVALRRTDAGSRPADVATDSDEPTVEVPR